MVMVVVNAHGQEARGGVIHPWEQFVHSFRTQVASIHHNVTAAIVETFGESWQPSEEPIWLLGRRFEARGPGRADEPAGVASELSSTATEAPAAGGARTEALHAAVAAGAAEPSGTPEEFAAAWAQIARMTYRKGFAPMYRVVRNPSSGSEEQCRFIRLTSDAGWGCMIRVGQMLLATVLKRHFDCDGGFVQRAAGSDGSPGCASEAPDSCALERQFLDDPCPERSPFSIFGFIRTAHGREVTVPPGEEPAGGRTAAARAAGASPSRRQLTQKLPGDWFGPTTISETVAALIEQRPELESSLAVYIDADGVLYEDEVRALAYGEDQVASAPESLSPGRGCAGKVGWGGSSPGARAGAVGGDSGWEVVSTASVSSASAWSPHESPLLCTVRADSSQVGSPYLMTLDSGCFGEARIGDDERAQSNLELVEFSDDLLLPPAAVDAPGGAGEGQSEGDSPAGGPSSGASASTSRPPPRWQRAVLLLFPLQLGLGKYVHERYASGALRYFELPSSLGAMGGRPRMAHFFVGRQERGLLYVDPHVVQAAVTASDNNTDESVGADGGPSAASEAFRNAPKVQTIEVEHIDSSISFAFYIRSEEDLAELLAGLRLIEADEADAPVRVERTRPLALRHPQVVDHSFLEGDPFGVDDAFLEADLAEVERPLQSGDCARPAGAGDDDGWDRGADGGDSTADDLCLSASEQAPPAGGERRALCVGPAWADISTPWAEVDVSVTCREVAS